MDELIEKSEKMVKTVMELHPYFDAKDQKQVDVYFALSDLKVLLDKLKKNIKSLCVMKKSHRLLW